MKLRNYLIWAFFVLMATACSNNSPDDLSTPATVANVTYSADIKPIIDANCLGCHKNPPENGAPMSLTTYDFVKSAITTRPFVDRISRPQGAEGMMPLGGTRLPQSSIELIKKWQEQGLQQ